MLTKILFIGIGLLYFSIQDLSAITKKIDIREAIRLSDEQRILAQKAAKIYIGLCNNLKDIKLYQERDLVINEFKENLYQLGTYTPTDPIRATLKEVNTVWEEYVAIVGWSIKKEDGAKLLKQLNVMLQSTKNLHSAYLDYEADLNPIKPTADMMATNLVIKKNENQKILIERILLYYLAEKSGITAVESGHKLDEANTTFTTLLNELINAKPSSVLIQNKYKEIKEDWLGISKHLVFTSKRQKDHLDDMYLRADKISANLDATEALLKDLGKALSVSSWLLEINKQSFAIQELKKNYTALLALEDSSKYDYKKYIYEQAVLVEQEIATFEKTVPNLTIKKLVGADLLSAWNVYKNYFSDLENITLESSNQVVEKSNAMLVVWEEIEKEILLFSEKLMHIQNLTDLNDSFVDVAVNPFTTLQHCNALQTSLQNIAIDYIIETHAPNPATEQALTMDIGSYNKKYILLLEYEKNSVAKQRILESCTKEWTWLSHAYNNVNEGDLLVFLKHTATLSQKLYKLNKLYNYQIAKAISEHSPQKAVEHLSTQNDK